MIKMKKVLFYANSVLLKIKSQIKKASFVSLLLSSLSFLSLALFNYPWSFLRDPQSSFIRSLQFILPLTDCRTLFYFPALFFLSPNLALCFSTYALTHTNWTLNESLWKVCKWVLRTIVEWGPISAALPASAFICSEDVKVDSLLLICLCLESLHWKQCKLD